MSTFAIVLYECDADHARIFRHIHLVDARCSKTVRLISNKKYKALFVTDGHCSSRFIEKGLCVDASGRELIEFFKKIAEKNTFFLFFFSTYVGNIMEERVFIAATEKISLNLFFNNFNELKPNVKYVVFTPTDAGL